MTSFALEQNYPNPFNPSTTIRYELPAASHASLIIYDVLGREALKAVDGLQDAGSHTATIDGSKLPSGIYFYRLSSRNHVEVKRMILVR
jgi:hypothetical protein